MKMPRIVASTLAAPLFLALAPLSYATVEAQSPPPPVNQTAPASTNAATPAVPGGPGTPATPAIPGNPTAQQATEHAEAVHQRNRLIAIARDRARLARLKALVVQYTAAGQSEKVEAIRARIRRLRARIERIHDHIQRFRAAELSERATGGAEVPVRHVVHVDIDRPHITRPHIVHPEIVRPEIERPTFEH